MENSEQEKENFRNQWKLIPTKHFLHTLEVGQYVFSKRSSSEVVAAKADETFFDMTAELNRRIDRLLHQPGGGDHPALDWMWDKLDRKLIKKFDLYMKVVDKSQLLNLPRNASILDVTPASGLIYSQIVEVPLIDGIIDNPAPQVVMDREKELQVIVEMEDQGGDVDQQLDQEGEGSSQLETDGLEQNEKANSPPEPEGNVESGSKRNVEANCPPEPEVSVDSGLEHDEESDHQLELEANDFPPLPGVMAVRLAEPVTWPRSNEMQAMEIEVNEFPPLPGVGAVGLDELVIWPRSNGIQAMEIEESIQVLTPKAPEMIRLVPCNIKMLRLEDMIEPEAMAMYWRKYNESVNLTADEEIQNQTLKPILKSQSGQIVEKKNVRFQVNVELETPTCQNSVHSKKRRQKKKYELILGGVLTRSAQKKLEEKKKQRFNGILLQPDLVNQVRFLRSRLI